jgi:hypothetical protein
MSRKPRVTVVGVPQHIRINKTPLISSSPKKIVYGFITMGVFIIFCQPEGFVTNLVELLPNHECIRSSLIKVSYVIVGGSFVYLLLLLKTFAFNIYTIVMNFLRWEYYED